MICQVVWRCGTMAYGAQSVTMAGTTWMPLWCASHWGTRAGQRVKEARLTKGVGRSGRPM